MLLSACVAVDVPEVPAEFHQACRAEVLCGSEASLSIRARGCYQDEYDLAGLVGEACDDLARETCAQLEPTCLVECDPPGRVPCL